MSVVMRRVTQIASNLSLVDFNPYKIVFLSLSGLGAFLVDEKNIESIVTSGRFQQRLLGYLFLPRFWISL
jgi:hypothetical protein